MSTRSTIAQRLPDGSYRSVYSHSDGYPEWIGRSLLRRYSRTESVNALLALGELLSLSKEGEPVLRDTDDDSDGNYDDPDLITLKTGAREQWCEWLYVWENNQWTAYTRETGRIAFTGHGEDQWSLPKPLAVVVSADDEPSTPDRSLYHPEYL